MDDCEEEYMAIRNIRTLGDDILRAKAKEITEMTQELKSLLMICLIQCMRLTV